jgi:hypothetical protein
MPGGWVNRQGFYKRQRTSSHLNTGNAQRPESINRKIPFSQRNLPFISKQGRSDWNMHTNDILQQPAASQSATYSQKIPISNRLLNGGCFLFCAAVETGGILLWAKGAKGKAEFSHQLEAATSIESQADALMGIGKSQSQVNMGSITAILISVPMIYAAKWLFFPEKGSFRHFRQKIRNFFRMVNNPSEDFGVFTSTAYGKLNRIREKGIDLQDVSDAVVKKRDAENREF